MNPPVCIVCGSLTRPYCVKDAAQYLRCPHCGLMFQHPLPTLQEMIDYADAQYADGLYTDYMQARDLKYATFRRRLRVIEPLAKGKRLLDVGSSCGFLIDVALEGGYDAYGVEFSAVAIAAASPQARPRITRGDVNTLETGSQASYDVVSAYDILEHTREPFAFLDSLRELLVPGGLLTITTPNTAHFLRYLMRSRWPMLQPFQHTYLFSPRSLRLALEKTGFRDIQIAPASKVLTPDYLAGQLRTLNPVFSRLYKIFASVLPGKLRTLPIPFNIGEIWASAYRAK